MRPNAVTLCLEQTLGHRTHGENLVRAMSADGAGPQVIRVEYEDPSRRRLPWALAGSRDAYRQLRARGKPAGVTLFHTQTIALLAPLAVRGGRYVVSVDATPVQFDRMGAWYRHARGNPAAEFGKRAWYRAVLGRAASVVAWSHWAATSLTSDYGVPRERILVAHPGAPPELFAIPRTGPRKDRPPRILFVGGDFERKGGPMLLDAFQSLAGRAELTVMTEARIAARPGVEVLTGVRPGTEAFLRAFSEADIFCLPTHGDCTPVVLGEAMAAGLPVITTDVGSNRETVPSGAGLVIPPGDPGALAEALVSLLEDPAERASMSVRAREYAREHLSAERNARRVAAHLAAIV